MLSEEPCRNWVDMPATRPVVASRSASRKAWSATSARLPATDPRAPRWRGGCSFGRSQRPTFGFAPDHCMAQNSVLHATHPVCLPYPIPSNALAIAYICCVAGSMCTRWARAERSFGINPSLFLSALSPYCPISGRTHGNTKPPHEGVNDRLLHHPKGHNHFPMERSVENRRRQLQLG